MNDSVLGGRLAAFSIAFLAALCVVGSALAVSSSGHARSAAQSEQQDGQGSPAADDYAPIGVTGDHTHSAGEWMLSYRYMYIRRSGSLDGTTDVSDEDVVDPTGYDFLVTPTEMPTHMHMFGLMYAPIDRITLTLTVPLMSSSMDHLMRTSATFGVNSEGLGDVAVGVLVRLKSWDGHHVHANLALSIPTGSITEEDVTPISAPDKKQLAYPMQMGSGTWDIEPGLTYGGHTGAWGWGGQAKGTLRLGENDHGYTLGPRGQATAWGSWALNEYVSFSGRVEGTMWGDIDGSDPAYDVEVAMRLLPTVFTDLRAGKRFDVGVGVNLLAPEETFHNVRIAGELILPAYQSLDGPQLKTQLHGILGVQYTF
jgi:hypothetical protein